VIDALPPAGEVLDLYAGVGLFSVALAGTGRMPIVAVEGDRISGADLLLNVGPFAAAVKVVPSSVEDYLGRRRGPSPRAIVVDPPRTGISKEAMKTVARQGAERVVYVSCDPATMARDARRLLDAGYRMVSIRAFDLFPNTPHVETLAVFDL
jgi:23S rRNA (uracil1939-C5)-methyltransferase